MEFKRIAAGVYQEVPKPEGRKRYRIVQRADDARWVVFAPFSGVYERESLEAAQRCAEADEQIDIYHGLDRLDRIRRGVA